MASIRTAHSLLVVNSTDYTLLERGNVGRERDGRKEEEGKNVMYRESDDRDSLSQRISIYKKICLWSWDRCGRTMVGDFFFLPRLFFLVSIFTIDLCVNDVRLIRKGYKGE